MNGKDDLRVLVETAWINLLYVEKEFGHCSREYERVRTKWAALDLAWGTMFPGEKY